MSSRTVTMGEELAGLRVTSVKTGPDAVSLDEDCGGVDDDEGLPMVNTQTTRLGDVVLENKMEIWTQKDRIEELDAEV